MGTERTSTDSILTPQPDGKYGLDLKLLARLSRRPRLYSGGESSFWADPYISEHTLHAHLDPDTEAASRPPEQIQQTVQLILESARGTEVTPDTGQPETSLQSTALSILDLGCGPGLYAQRFAQAGCTVTGIDLSPRSVEYAREKAVASELPVLYRCEDLRQAKLGGPFDVVTMIYGEFCTFSERERGDLLKRIRRALRPGGLFVFDVFNRSYVDRIRGGNDWYVTLSDGFWQDGEHLVLEQTFDYPKDSANVIRYSIIDSSGSIRQYSVWWRYYSQDEIVQVVTGAGFHPESIYGSLWGNPVTEDDEWMGLYCRRT